MFCLGPLAGRGNGDVEVDGWVNVIDGGAVGFEGVLDGELPRLTSVEDALIGLGVVSEEALR